MKRIIPVDPVFRIPNENVNSEALVQRAIEKQHAFETDRSQYLSSRLISLE